jgi:hypothetical protein
MTSRACFWSIALCALALGACASMTAPAASAFTGKPVAKRDTKALKAPVDDHSMCEWKGHDDREASETAGPGALKPNVRRVFQIIGTGEDRHKVLICRESDTNFDGIKDVVRRYNDKGESLHEESDANYDGRLDTWITFAKGRLAEVQVDNDHDGKPDEWKFYSEGQLARIKRDTNHDGKPDVWEIYREGKLERMGVDVDGDERVDRWDHDTELRRRFEEAERKKDEEAQKREAEKKAAAQRDAEDDAAGSDSAPQKPDAADKSKETKPADDTKTPPDKATGDKAKK